MANCSQPFADISEFLRKQKCDGEINHQEDGEDESGCRDPIHVHWLPQLLARLDVEKRHGEENYGEQHHQCVLHSGSPLLLPAQCRKWLAGQITSRLARACSAFLIAPEIHTHARAEPTGVA